MAATPSAGDSTEESDKAAMPSVAENTEEVEAAMPSAVRTKKSEKTEMPSVADDTKEIERRDSSLQNLALVVKKNVSISGNEMSNLNELGTKRMERLERKIGKMALGSLSSEGNMGYSRSDEDISDGY